MASDEVMMTEIVDEDEDGDGDGSDPGLSKCLVHLPRNWRSETLKSFLSEQASWVSLFENLSFFFALI